MNNPNIYDNAILKRASIANLRKYLPKKEIWQAILHARPECA
jgi:hypothetical protein